MAREESPQRTWTFDSGLAAWEYELSCLPGEGAQVALRRIAVDVIEAARLVGDVAHIEWITQSVGDDAAVLDRPFVRDPDAVSAVFSRFDDLLEVAMDLDLRCLTTTGDELVIEQGARVTLEIESESELILRFRLDADIYSPRTRTPVQDNRELAAINGPRLAAFLRHLGDAMGGTLTVIDAPAYKDLATPEGFGMPSPS